MMREAIYDRQTELRMRMTERDRMKKRYEAKEAERAGARRDYDRLKARLTKEQQDVLKLGQFSFANKFRQLTGKTGSFHTEAALAYGDGFKPDTILINGDLFDFHAISRFDKDPTKPKILYELECGKQFFAHLQARYPKARVVFKLGNHDEARRAYEQAVRWLDMNQAALTKGHAGVLRRLRAEAEEVLGLKKK